MAVYFGVDHDPIQIFELDSNWTHYSVYGEGTDYTQTLGIYSNTGGVSIYLDDIRLFEFGPP